MFEVTYLSLLAFDSLLTDASGEKSNLDILEFGEGLVKVFGDLTSIGDLIESLLIGDLRLSSIFTIVDWENI